MCVCFLRQEILSIRSFGWYEPLILVPLTPLSLCIKLFGGFAFYKYSYWTSFHKALLYAICITFDFKAPSYICSTFDSDSKGMEIWRLYCTAEKVLIDVVNAAMGFSGQWSIKLSSLFMHANMGFRNSLIYVWFIY